MREFWVMEDVEDNWGREEEPYEDPPTGVHACFPYPFPKPPSLSKILIWGGGGIGIAAYPAEKDERTKFIMNRWIPGTFCHCPVAL